MLDRTEITQLQDEQEEDLNESWRNKAQKCPLNKNLSHDYMPIVWTMTLKTKHVTTLMCKRCFHAIGIAEAFDKRTIA
jgi:hypothetical protein